MKKTMKKKIVENLSFVKKFSNLFRNIYEIDSDFFISRPVQIWIKMK